MALRASQASPSCGRGSGGSTPPTLGAATTSQRSLADTTSHRRQCRPCGQISCCPRRAQVAMPIRARCPPVDGLRVTLATVIGRINPLTFAPVGYSPAHCFKCRRFWVCEPALPGATSWNGRCSSTAVMSPAIRVRHQKRRGHRPGGSLLVQKKAVGSIVV